MNTEIEFSIRRATLEDVPSIRSVLYAVRREYGVLWEIGANDPELDDLASNYFRRGGHFEVIENMAQRIVGCAGLYPSTSRRAELGKMYLEFSARGRGLGRRLLENMLAAARQNGFAEVWLETSSSLIGAITLYRQFGFEPDVSAALTHHCDAAYLLRLE
ncbi:MAG: GNAT family N-acetyltransferase [Planctomycetaceae bacterium]|nr:MAG: GNAT family N-acetyltransferase [Planctomycetaceae bacterium]